MDLHKLLNTYKNGRRVRERRYSFEPLGAARTGTIDGSSLGGRVLRGDYRPMLAVHVKWDDGTESTAHHSAFEVI